MFRRTITCVSHAHSSNYIRRIESYRNGWFAMRPVEAISSGNRKVVLKMFRPRLRKCSNYTCTNIHAHRRVATHSYIIPIITWTNKLAHTRRHTDTYVREASAGNVTKEKWKQIRIVEIEAYESSHWFFFLLRFSPLRSFVGRRRRCFFLLSRFSLCCFSSSVHRHRMESTNFCVVGYFASFISFLRTFYPFACVFFSFGRVVVVNVRYLPFFLTRPLILFGSNMNLNMCVPELSEIWSWMNFYIYIYILNKLISEWNFSHWSSD